MATLSARGLMGEGDVYRARSIIGSEFICRIPCPTTIGRPAIIPAVSGRAWSTGVSQYMLDPAIRGPQATGFLTHGRALGSQFDRLAWLVDAKPRTLSSRRLNWLAWRSGPAPRSLGAASPSTRRRLRRSLKAALQHKGAAFIVIRLALHSTVALARPRASIPCSGAILRPTRSTSSWYWSR
jgi:hypothetical protein